MLQKSEEIMLKDFIKEAYNCRSAEKARDLQRKLREFYAKHDIQEEDDLFLKEGVGEMIAMMAE